jgi:hypothetical protein
MNVTAKMKMEEIAEFLFCDFESEWSDSEHVDEMVV